MSSHVLPRPDSSLQAPASGSTSSNIPLSLPPPARSDKFVTNHSSPPPAEPVKPPVSERRPSAARLPSTPSYVPQRNQAYPSSLPPRPSETVIAYSNKASYKPGYSPVTSASDGRLSYSTTGPISNPLNIRPSRFAPLKATPIHSQPAPKKLLAIGNGWPHTRQANGHGSASISPVTKAPPPPSARRSRTPESTRSSRTPPGLTNFVAYTSPSPPGFLHRLLRDKPNTESSTMSPCSYGPPWVKDGKDLFPL